MLNSMLKLYYDHCKFHLTLDILLSLNFDQPYNFSVVRVQEAMAWSKSGVKYVVGWSV